jgi:flagellar biosynthesis/type III secretory pathway M-ring protein FliF/YscJ
MTEDEAILWMTIGFMIIIGIWLISLTYLVLKRTKPTIEKEEKEPKEEEPAAEEEKAAEDTEEKEEVEEPEEGKEEV